MIEIELPNLKVDESQISPTRVKVLSRDGDRKSITVGNQAERKSIKSGLGNYGITADKNLLDSEEHSEGEILHDMEAKIRPSQKHLA